MKYNALLKIVETTDYAPVIGQVVPLLLGERYRTEHPEAVDAWRERMKGNAPTGTVQLGRSIFGRDSVLSELGRVSQPVLMIAGSEDEVVPLDNLRATHDALPNSTMVIAPGSGHSTPIEQPDTALNAIGRFFKETAETTRITSRNGLSVRQHGNAHAAVFATALGGFVGGGGLVLTKADNFKAVGRKLVRPLQVTHDR